MTKADQRKEKRDEIRMKRAEEKERQLEEANMTKQEKEQIRIQRKKGVYYLRASLYNTD